MSNRHLLSKGVIFLMALIFLVFLHRYTKWSSNIISGGDGWGYYMYLPAVFIYGDLGDLEQSYLKKEFYYSGSTEIDSASINMAEAPMHESGRRVMKFTMGLAILYAPFFLLAHFLASIGGYPADGYSPIYIYTMHLAAVFFVLMGFVLLRKVLLKWFSDKIVAMTLFLLGLGTNLYFFTVYDSVMAHAYLFFLYCLLIYATQNWYATSRTKFALLVGLAAGFITLIRPTEIICLAIPLLWGVNSVADFRARLRFIGSHYKSYLMSVLTFTFVGLPQLVYWKWASGHFLYYSYGEEGFDFANPHLIEGLFGFKNGWLAYTPLMVFALLGIYFLFRKRHAALLPLLVFLPIQIYVTYSWWCWNYIRGFGSRPMVETYALLSIPLAFFLQKILRGTKWLKVIVFATLGFFIFQNMFQTEQMYRGLLWPEASNWAFYKRTFGKKKLNYLDILTFDTAKTPPNESKLSYISTIYENDFEDSLNVYYQKNIPDNNSRVFVLNNQKQYSPGMNKKIETIPDIQPGDWIKVSVDAMLQHDASSLYRMSSLVATVAPDKEWLSTRIENKVGNRFGTLWAGRENIWDNVYIWMQIPKNVQASDQLKSYVWNSMVHDIYLDNMKVEIWR